MCKLINKSIIRKDSTIILNHTKYDIECINKMTSFRQMIWQLSRCIILLQKQTYDEAIHALANTLLANTMTLCITLIIAGKLKVHILDYTIPSWPLPWIWFFPRFQYMAKLHMGIFVYLTLPPALARSKPPFSPNSVWNIQIIEFTYRNNRFPMPRIAYELDQYVALQPLISQKGWNRLAPIILTTSIRGTIHNHIVQSLKNLNITPHNTNKVMESFSQTPIKCLAHIMLNKCKLELYPLNTTDTTPCYGPLTNNRY